MQKYNATVFNLNTNLSSRVSGAAFMNNETRLALTFTGCASLLVAHSLLGHTFLLSPLEKSVAWSPASSEAATYLSQIKPMEFGIISKSFNSIVGGCSLQCSPHAQNEQSVLLVLPKLLPFAGLLGTLELIGMLNENRCESKELRKTYFLCT